jgi:hypothetical protein
MAPGSGGDGGVSGDSGEVVFRLDRGFRRPLLTHGSGVLAVAVLVAVVAAVVPGSGSLHAFLWSLASVIAAVGLCYAVRYVWVGRFRTRLSPQGIEIRGYFGHFVPWSDVTGVEVTTPEATGEVLHSGTRGVRATEVDPSGQPQLVDQLAGQGDSGFRAKLATVRVARAHGHRLLLRAPLVTAWQGDPEFQDKVQTIRQWWQTYGQGTPTPTRPTSTD